MKKSYAYPITKRIVIEAINSVLGGGTTVPTVTPSNPNDGGTGPFQSTSLRKLYV